MLLFFITVYFLVGAGAAAGVYANTNSVLESVPVFFIWPSLIGYNMVNG